MITLHDKKGAKQICSLVTKKKKQPIYYIGEVDESRISTADTRTLLGGHIETLRNSMRIKQDHMETALQHLVENTEPEDEGHPHIKRGFWRLKELKQDLLTREMDIRSEKDQHFEINIPKKKEEFFGHMGALGASSSGKGYFITDLILRHWKSTSYLQRRHVYYVSAEATIDKTLNRLRVRKYEEFLHVIDVSFEAGEESNLSRQDFWLEKVEGAIGEVRDAIIVLDDVQDSYGLPSDVLTTLNRTLRIGRHRNLSVISVFHSIKNGAWTRQLTQSAKYLVLFPRSQQGRTRDFFYEVLGMPRREALDLTKFIQKCGRACIVRTHAPVCIICEKYLKLI